VRSPRPCFRLAAVAVVGPVKLANRAAKPGRKPRAKVTAQIRAGVKTLTRAGKTGSAIAEALGISLATVQNIKKASGLVAKRKK
jgi:hypothetical protein